MNSKIINYFRNSDPILYSAYKKIQPINIVLRKSDNYFSDLCRVIINQQLSDKAASTIFNKFRSLFPNKDITPQYLSKISEVNIRKTGPSLRKIYYMKGLAQLIIDKEIDLPEMGKLSDNEVRMNLIKVKGIGNWTIDMFLMSTLGREDIFSAGDLGLRKAVQNLYKLKKEPTVKQLEKISKKWSPYRTYASRILWRSLEL